MGRLLDTLPEDKPLYALNVGDFKILMAEIMQANSNPLPEQPQQSEPVKEDYSISEIAKRLRVSEGTIHRYKNNKVLPFYKAGRTVFFKITEVEEALSSAPKKKGASTK